MKKSHFFLIMLFLGIVTQLYSQPGTVKLPNGDTKTTTETTDATGTTTTTEEFRKADRTLRGGRTTVKDIQGRTTVTDSLTTPGGRPQHVTVKRTNVAGDTIYRHERNYDDKGKDVVSFRTREYNTENGYVRITERPLDGTIPFTTPFSSDPGPLDPIRDTDKPLSYQAPPAPVSLAERPAEGTEAVKDCNKPDIDVFIAYSYMTGFREGEDLALALGGHLAVTYWLNKRIGLVGDFSYHTKKENDLRIAQMYLMGGAQYLLYACQVKRQREFLMYVRLLAGMAQDRLKFTYGNMSATDKYKAFSAAAGLGFMYQLGNAMFLSLLTDYIHTRFNGEGQSNLRASIGVKFNFGCK